MPDYVFQCYLTRNLRSLGLLGSEAWVRVNDQLIEWSGTEGGQLRVRLDDVTRLRVGFLDSRSRTYEARIWRFGAEKPLRLMPTISSWAAYREAMLFLANALIAHRRLDRIERGYSKFDAIFGPAMAGLLLIAAIGISIFALGNEPWWGRLLAPAVPLILFSILLWLGVARYWPRPIRDVSELTVQLPPIPRA